MYHYVEGVIEYGASEKKFLELMDELELSAEEVTGLYAVRKLVADASDGNTPSFPLLLSPVRVIINILSELGAFFLSIDGLACFKSS